jgi:hypothetical protein
VKHDDDKKGELARFRALVEAYGANPEKWPAEERPTFERFASSAEGRAWLVEQRSVDAWLDASTELEPSADLLRRVAEIPVRNAKPAARVWPFGRMRGLVGALAAAAAVGMVVGMTTNDATSDDGEAWDDLSTLALGADFAEEP